jgi:hypothetical protein
MRYDRLIPAVALAGMIALAGCGREDDTTWGDPALETTPATDPYATDPYAAPPVTTDPYGTTPVTPTDTVLDPVTGYDTVPMP